MTDQSNTILARLLVNQQKWVFLKKDSNLKWTELPSNPKHPDPELSSLAQDYIENTE